MYTTFEEELEQNGKLVYTNVGVSMLPLLREGRDVMLIEKTDVLKPLDANVRVSTLTAYSPSIYSAVIPFFLSSAAVISISLIHKYVKLCVRCSRLYGFLLNRLLCRLLCRLISIILCSLGALCL